MKARCLISFFTNDVSGTKGEIIEITEQSTFDDLLSAGYIESVDPKKKPDDIEQQKAKSKAKVIDSHESQ